MDARGPNRGLVLVAVLLVLAVGGALALATVAPSANGTADPVHQDAETARLWVGEILATAQYMRDIAAPADAATAEKAVEALHESTKKRARYMHELQRSIDTPEAALAMQEVFDARVIFAGPEHDILRRARAGFASGTQQILLEDALPAHVTYVEKLVTLADVLRARRDHAQARAALRQAYARNAATGLLGLAVVLCATLAVALYRLRPRRDAWAFHSWAAL